jgi:hypothetical protein
MGRRSNLGVSATSPIRWGHEHRNWSAALFVIARFKCASHLSRRRIETGCHQWRSGAAALAGREHARRSRQRRSCEGRQEAEASLRLLVKDGVLTEDERRHMVALIGKRNGIAHHLDHVTADLTTDRSVRDWIDYLPNRQTHDYETLDQLRAARRLVSDRMAERHYVLEIDIRHIFFTTTEQVLSSDIKALERRIRSLVRARRDEIAQLNAELSLEGTELTGLFDPRWPENRYGTGQRLTPRGVETCYLLFDLGKSPLAVAHLVGLSLTATRRRQQMWRALGGLDRERRPLADIPKVRRRMRLED